MKIGDFFKTGDFWSSLELTIKKIKNSISLNSKNIKKLHNNDIELMRKVNQLIKENIELKKDFKELESKLWTIMNRQADINNNHVSKNYYNIPETEAPIPSLIASSDTNVQK